MKSKAPKFVRVEMTQELWDIAMEMAKRMRKAGYKFTVYEAIKSALIRGLEVDAEQMADEDAMEVN